MSDATNVVNIVKLSAHKYCVGKTGINALKPYFHFSLYNKCVDEKLHLHV